MLLTVLSIRAHCATGVAPSEARLRHDDEACDPAACTPPPRPEQLDPEGLAQKGRPHARAPRRAKRRKVCKFGEGGHNKQPAVSGNTYIHRLKHRKQMPFICVLTSLITAFTK